MSFWLKSAKYQPDTFANQNMSPSEDIILFRVPLTDTFCRDGPWGSRISFSRVPGTQISRFRNDTCLPFSGVVDSRLTN